MRTNRQLHVRESLLAGFQGPRNGNSYSFNIPLKNGGFYVNSCVTSEITKNSSDKLDDKTYINDLIEQISGKFDLVDLYLDFEAIDSILGDWAILVAVGSELVQRLIEIGEKNEDVTAKALATRLLGDIARDTRKRLSGRSSSLVCPECFVRYGVQECELSWIKEYITHYGCRSCGCSRGYFEYSGDIIAVLNAKMIGSYSRGSELRVNWLRLRRIFDFDRVEIIDATDEDVERFVVQIGNDMDRVRNSKDEQIPCVISPDCSLSANTRHILHKSMRQVITEVKQTSN